MSLLKKLLSGDKLSKYEKEQKRRYKQYVKLGTTNTIVLSKSEPEIYQDYLVRQKSLRRSKRKSSASKAAKHEDIFKDLSPSAGLGAAPAVLDAVNRNVSVNNIPDKHLNDLRQLEVITVETHTSSPHTESHKNSEYFQLNKTPTENKEDERERTIANKNTQPLKEKFSFGNQDKFLNQLDEIIRHRNKGNVKDNVVNEHESSSFAIYENIEDVKEQSRNMPAINPRKKLSKKQKGYKEKSDIPNEDAQPNTSHLIQIPPHNLENSADFYQSENEELIWGTPPNNALPPTSRSNSCVTTQSEDSFFDCISEDGDIYDDEEKNVMKQISPYFREKTITYNYPEIDFRSLGSEDDLDQKVNPPPQYDSVIKTETGIVELTTGGNNNSNNMYEDSIEPDSLEVHVDAKLRERGPEPESVDHTAHIMTSWAEKVRIKERDFISNEQLREKTHEHEEAQRYDEAVLLDESYDRPNSIISFRDDPEFLKIGESNRTSKNYLTKLENNNDYSDIDIENDRNDGKKVTFDFAKSYCTTYKVDSSPDDDDLDNSILLSSLTRQEGQVFTPVDNQLYFDNYYNGVNKKKKHALPNLNIPTDDRSRVFLSYGVQPTPTPEEEIIDKLFENSTNMDLAFLNCIDGFNSQFEQSRPRNTVKIIELDDEEGSREDSDQNKSETEFKGNPGILNESTVRNLSEINHQTQSMPSASADNTTQTKTKIKSTPDSSLSLYEEYQLLNEVNHRAESESEYPDNDRMNDSPKQLHDDSYFTSGYQSNFPISNLNRRVREINEHHEVTDVELQEVDLVADKNDNNVRYPQEPIPRNRRPQFLEIVVTNNKQSFDGSHFMSGYQTDLQGSSPNKEVIEVDDNYQTRDDKLTDVTLLNDKKDKIVEKDAGHSEEAIPKNRNVQYSDNDTINEKSNQSLIDDHIIFDYRNHSPISTSNRVVNQINENYQTTDELTEVNLLKDKRDKLKNKYAEYSVEAIPKNRHFRYYDNDIINEKPNQSPIDDHFKFEYQNNVSVSSPNIITKQIDENNQITNEELKEVNLLMDKRDGVIYKDTAYHEDVIPKNSHPRYSDNAVIINEKSSQPLISDNFISEYQNHSSVSSPNKIVRQIHDSQTGNESEEVNELVDHRNKNVKYPKEVLLITNSKQELGVHDGDQAINPLRSINPFVLDRGKSQHIINTSSSSPNEGNQDTHDTESADNVNVNSSFDSGSEESLSFSSRSMKSPLWGDSFQNEDKVVTGNNSLSSIESSSHAPNMQNLTEVNSTSTHNSKIIPPKRPLYIALNRSTSAPFVSKPKTKTNSIYSNRSIFTTKPLNRSVSHPASEKSYKSNPPNNEENPTIKDKDSSDGNQMTDDQTANDGQENIVKPLIEIQRRLSEVRNIETAEMQLTTMQEILINLKQRADKLESKTDDEYIKLLQTLFKSIRVVSGLECNYDQSLLASQQKTLKDIKGCISELNFK